MFKYICAAAIIQEHRKMIDENMRMMHSMRDSSKCGSMEGGHKDM